MSKTNVTRNFIQWGFVNLIATYDFHFSWITFLVLSTFSVYTWFYALPHILFVCQNFRQHFLQNTEFRQHVCAFMSRSIDRSIALFAIKYTKMINIQYFPRIFLRPDNIYIIVVTKHREKELPTLIDWYRSFWPARSLYRRVEWWRGSKDKRNKDSLVKR
jgi:hypothetical protein